MASTWVINVVFVNTPRIKCCGVFFDFVQSNDENGQKMSKTALFFAQKQSKNKIAFFTKTNPRLFCFPFINIPLISPPLPLNSPPLSPTTPHTL
jgi:hypothetical protein